MGEHTHPGELIGSDRDGARLANVLRGRTSLVIVGTLGSGKSHLMRDVTARLREAGVDPLIVRTGGPLAGIPYGALDAAHDTRARALREPATIDGEHLFVVVDDAHELDAESATALSRAVYSGRATALLTLTSTGDERSNELREDSPATRAAVDLWLRGLADRTDLRGLSEAEEQALLSHFGGDCLDTLTRAIIMGLADGSRMLLRELTREALAALARDRDPVAAFRDAPANGRLADAMAAHASQLPSAQRAALALLGRVPRIALSDAARLLPLEDIDRLVAARLAHMDGTPRRHLTASSMLADAAYRLGERDQADRVLVSAMRDMLADDAGWWSMPIARRIAEGWHRGDETVPPIDDVPGTTRTRVLVAAARLANDAGDSDLASSFARLGLRWSKDVALELELVYATAIRGVPIDVADLAQVMNDAPLARDTLLRWVRMGRALPSERVGNGMNAAVRRLAATVSTDPESAAEAALLLAQSEALDMHWDSARRIVAELPDRRDVSASFRSRAAAVSGATWAHAGDRRQMEYWFQRAHRLSGDREVHTAAPTTERLWALVIEMVSLAMNGGDTRDTLALVERECRAAGAEGDPATVAQAGMVLAASLAAIGDADRALVELRASRRRARSPLSAGLTSFVQVLVARALAAAGRLGDAQATLRLADPALVDAVPMLVHARATTESFVLAGQNRQAEAADKAREACDAAAPTPALFVRALFCLWALTGRPRDLATQLRQIAEETALPVAEELATIAEANPAEKPASLSPFEFMRFTRGDARFTHDDDLVSPSGASQPIDGSWRAERTTFSLAPAPRLTMPAKTDPELTRREREIALLVAEGLSNREIATRLYLSVRTVESHIYQGRAKVDARSRGELGRIVATGGRLDGAAPY